MTFYEAQVHALLLEARAIEIRVFGMQAHDKTAEARGKTPYTESDYVIKAHEIYAIEQQIQEIARKGYLA